jgi:AbrB family looped-hinge helix DNA binding protein
MIACAALSLTLFHYRGNVMAMTIAQSKLTSQGQISVPSEVRKKLGVGPGSVLEWHEQGDQIVVRRADRYGWDDVRKALFPRGPPQSHTLDELKDGKKTYIRRKYARG